MNQLKVSAGFLKRSNLKVPVSAKPVKSIIKQSVFNIIDKEIEGKTVVDLFSGSGNLGIEAVSRGASYTVLVENDFEAIKVIKENIINLNIDNKVEVNKQDALKYIGNSAEKFDIVFADPPYINAKKHFLKTVNFIVKDKGILIYFYKKDVNIPQVEEMKPIKTSCFGNSCYTIYNLI